MGNYVENLIQTVIENSQSNNWEDAVCEWEIEDWQEDEKCSSKCLCGKENIKYLYTIKNNCNNNVLAPIGSSCIKKFGRDDLFAETSLIEKQFKLLHAFKNHEFITLTTDYFSKKIIDWLYEEGAFDTEYNYYDGYNDYIFFLKMFNKRYKEDITYYQNKKINAIIFKSIKPFIIEELSDKVINH